MGLTRTCVVLLLALTSCIAAKKILMLPFQMGSHVAEATAISKGLMQKGECPEIKYIQKSFRQHAY